MTEKDMEDVLQIRTALEELAIRLSCQKITLEELTELQAAMDQFETMTKTGDIVEIARADVNFHDVLYKASDNPKLLGLLNNLREQMYRYRVEYLKDSSIYPRLIEEHHHMYEALREKDVQKAAAYTRKHLQNQAETVKKIIREQE